MDLKAILGFTDKPIYKSLTAWGLALFFVAGKGLEYACGCDPTTQVCSASTVGLLSQENCTLAGQVFQGVGVALTALGIRKAKTETPAPA